MTLVIRHGREADREAIIALVRELNVFENALSGDRREDRDGAEAAVMANERAILENGGLTVVAEKNGRLVGYMAMSFEETGAFVVAEKRTVGYVRELVVTRAERGRGIGRMLLEAAERATRERGLERLMLAALVDNHGALESYRRFGMKPYAIDMVKELD